MGMKLLKPEEYRSAQGRLNVLEPSVTDLRTLVDEQQKQIARISNNCDALYAGLMDVAARTPPVGRWARLKWVFRG